MIFLSYCPLFPFSSIEGNHEASQALSELYYGGWVAPNIYYLGAAGVVNFCGLRIGGISGIYKRCDYPFGRYEIPPYDRDTLRSVYHVRNVDVYRLLSLSKSSMMEESKEKPLLDVFLSHDWPLGIEQHGDTKDLLRRKPFFREEVDQNCLGSPPNMEILSSLKPKWWFAAHMHVKFKAIVTHDKNPSRNPVSKKGSESQDLKAITQIRPSSTVTSETKKRKSVDSDDVQEENAEDTAGQEDKPTTTQFLSTEGGNDPCSVPDLTEQMTKFLSLDKCLPRRHFLTIVNIPIPTRPDKPKLQYDVKWLSILRKTHGLSSRSKKRVDLPSDFATVDEEDMEWVHQKFSSLEIPENFVQTVPPVAKGSSIVILPHPLPPPLSQMGNPQTDDLLRILELDHIVTIPYSLGPQELDVDDRDEINIELSDDDT